MACAALPPLSAGCLNGVTRQLLLELGEGAIVERDVPVEALERASEAFVSSTVREVQPIATVNGITLPAAPGEITARLAKAFTQLTKTTPDP
jgi:branched-chain amino acid aminotransferase